jgi:hypothetical protein
LFVDLHYKKDLQPSGFRKNFDTYLIPDAKKSEDSEESDLKKKCYINKEQLKDELHNI